MKWFFERCNRFLELPLDPGPRGILLAAVLVLILSYLVPLWNLAIFTPQHPGVLQLRMYSNRLEEAVPGDGLKEIYALNRDIGLPQLSPSGFSAFRWIPFALGILALLILRAAVLGKMTHLVDTLVLDFYFVFFSFRSFGFWFGRRTLGNSEVSSYPGPGAYGLVLVALLLLLAVWVAWREERSLVNEEVSSP